MAIFSALLSALYRNLSKFLQTLFGWSITGLFGRLPSKQQTALSVAFVLALAWPLLVLGIFVPGIAAWAIAFVPIHKWVGSTTLRFIWLGLALVVPAIVGTVTAIITPATKQKGSTLHTVLGGYVLTVGYVVAFLITLVTVPVLKLTTMAKRWSDEHVYVQPREGAYDDVLDEIARACGAIGMPMERTVMPKAMSLATRMLKVLAHRFIEPAVAAESKMLRSDKLEVYLYPADLLLRGPAKTVARVRAAISETMVERFAFLVQEPKAQEIQVEIQRMWEVVARHDATHPVGRLANVRLREIQHDLRRVEIPFPEWAVLDRSLKRVERAIVGGPHILKPLVEEDQAA